MVTVQIFKITDLFLRKFSRQENTEKGSKSINAIKLHNNLQCRLTVDIFIPAENHQSLNNRRVKCKQTEENYRILIVLKGMQIFHRVLQTYAEFCRKMLTIFFPRIFYDVNWTCNLFFKDDKKRTGSTGNTGTLNTPYWKCTCTWNTKQVPVYLKYCPTLEQDNLSSQIAEVLCPVVRSTV